MNLRQRLVASFAVITVLMLAPAALAIVSLTTLQQMAVEGRVQHAAASLALGRFETALSELDRFQRSYLVTPDSVFLLRTESAIESLRDQLPPLREREFFGSSSLTPIVDSLARMNREIVELTDRGEVVQANTELFGGMQPLIGGARGRLSALADSIDRQAEVEVLRAQTITSSARLTILLLLAVCLALALLLGTWATHAIVAPIRRLAGGMAEVTGGSFETPDDLPYDRTDEIGELSASFRMMTARLAELDRMKTEFLGVAGHELKTPIGVISGYSDLIEEELTGELTEHQQEILHGITEQCRVMTRLLSRLMDISRLESGSYTLEMEATHVEDLVTGLVRAFDQIAAEKGADIRTRVEPSAPESLVLDVDLIRHEALGNLVSNAIKFVPERKGEVRIEVRGEDDEVVFQVSDNGPGIPEEHRPFIFEKHYQVERSRMLGSGLGLAIVREVVQLHGGDVRLVADGRPGATFEVRLPVRPAELASPDPAAPPPESEPPQAGEPHPESEPEGSSFVQG